MTLNFERMKHVLILRVSILWKDAIEYGSDEVYTGVKDLMEKFILADTNEELIALETTILLYETEVSLAIENSFRQMEKNWRERE